MTDSAGNFCVIGPLAQQSAQIMASVGEQAQVDFALGRKACSVAVVAKGLRNAADYADFTAPVLVSPALRRLAKRSGL